MQAAFSMIDTDNDGFISKKELNDFMLKVGMERSDEEIQGLIKDLDTDDNGQIDFAEFSKLMFFKHGDADSKEKFLRQLFNQLDRDGSGFLSVDELQHVLAKVGQPNPEDHAIKMIVDADVNDDNLISFDEFKRMMLDDYDDDYDDDDDDDDDDGNYIDSDNHNYNNNYSYIDNNNYNYDYNYS
ncbi:hypothetical protein CBR_g45618 [Chara braunii]|uniref:EF-hand domain-containing protein n=1 Tax=Chara braunii TaxID=69332 RepID=A0A388LZ07_CHABU|nr:hypothetical protein CBR_g45618 [Chara braunii]|eukprot:GBG87560.1 hypothetical protein CBR_g45618 [Chara braunii]